MIELLYASLLPLVAGFVVALALGPVVRRAAIRFDLYDRPDGGLKPHQKPIPYLGGLAIFFGWIASIVATACSRDIAMTPLLWLAGGGAILMLTGLIDDIRHLPPKVRLLIQAGVAALLLYGQIGDRSLAGLIAPLLPDFDPGAIPVLGLRAATFAFCALVIAGASNSTNLIDGMDGLCAGVMAVASLGFIGLVAALADDHNVSATGGTLIVTLAVAALGACLAFLVFNFNPASMFMGDSGSLLLGYSAATVIILFAEHASWRGLVAAAFVFGFPIFDTALAVGRRALNKKPLFVGDRSHFYDQIRDRGCSIKQTVLICYAVAAAFAVLGVALSWASNLVLACVAIGIPVAAAVACRQFGLLRVDDTGRSSSQPN